MNSNFERMNRKALMEAKREQEMLKDKKAHPEKYKKNYKGMEQLRDNESFFRRL